MSFYVGGKVIKNRLFVGTGKLPDYSVVKRMYEELGIEELIFLKELLKIESEKRIKLGHIA
jgi:thiazole synthase ThiGH ThiG subunit